MAGARREQACMPGARQSCMWPSGEGCGPGQPPGGSTPSTWRTQAEHHSPADTCFIFPACPTPLPKVAPCLDAFLFCLVPEPIGSFSVCPALLGERFTHSLWFAGGVWPCPHPTSSCGRIAEECLLVSAHYGLNVCVFPRFMLKP